jgi:hypothetical protein
VVWLDGTRERGGGQQGPGKKMIALENSTSVQIPRHGRSGSRGSLAKAQSAGGHRPNAIAIQKQPPPYLPLCRPSDTKQGTLKPEGGEGGGWGHPNSALPGPVPAMVPARPLNSSTSSHGLADVHETARLRTRLRVGAATVCGCACCYARACGCLLCTYAPPHIHSVHADRLQYTHVIPRILHS